MTQDAKPGRGRAVFVDRDGTLTREIGYMLDPSRLALLSGSARAVALLRRAGFRVVVTTNQSGVSRGYFSRAQVRRTHRRLSALLARQGVRLDAVYFCPHAPADRCRCRKPRTAMLSRAARRFGVSLRRSIVVGDKATDVLFARAGRCRSVLVLTGYGRAERLTLARRRGPRPDFVAKNLLSASRWILSEAGRGR